ncbi:DoxX family protein [Rubrivirga sp. IMCC45206]|uniref:DoxX family protein n=1 Tax=Rubrivirga sp. IMCC45206 TaxID=3391614 RepID=UPI00399025A1
MSIVLWALQIVLAVVFLALGGLKLAKPKEALLPQMGALAPYRPLTIKAIGASEVLAALGLVAAPLVGWGALVPWAALGVAAVMIFGAIAHGEAGEWKKIGLNAVLLALALVVVYGRSADLPL